MGEGQARSSVGSMETGTALTMASGRILSISSTGFHQARSLDIQWSFAENRCPPKRIPLLTPAGLLAQFLHLLSSPLSIS